uniref:Uncharacterized protein n=1 Tax=Tanacetum cinerariifolium TaxID=118510 RepID=A0A699UTW9_TANCI|nr:hypothetical protein [Tanacetum cinerariifolium]
MSLSIKEDDYYSERDILILKEFLSNNSLSLLENESFHFDIPSSSVLLQNHHMTYAHLNHPSVNSREISKSLISSGP